LFCFVFSFKVNCAEQAAQGRASDMAIDFVHRVR
jgi:hypothetical protein